MSERSGSDRASAPGVWQTFRESPVAVKAILAGVFVNRLGAFLTIFLVLYLVSKGYSTAQASMAIGAYGAGGMIGVLIGGVLAARLGARGATVLSMGSSALLLATIVYVPSYPAIVTAVFLVGLLGLLYRPASSSLLSELTPDDRQVMIFALYRWGLNLGTMAAPLLGQLLFTVGHRSFVLLFWGEALVAVVYALIAIFLIPGRRAEKALDKAAAPSGSAPSGGFRAVLADRRFMLFLIGMLVNTVVYVQYSSTLPLDVAKQHVAILWYTLAVALNGFVVIAFELPLTKYSQKWPIRRTLLIAWALVGIGEACYGFPLGAAAILAGTVVWSIAEIIGGPATFSFPAVAAPPHLRPAYIGSFQFAFNLASALGPVIGGELFVLLGHQVWPVMGGFGALACLLGALAFRVPAVATGVAEPEPEPVSGAV